MKISRLNGWSVVIFGALSVLLTLVFGDLLGMFIGLCVVLAGGMEIRGGRQLRQRNPDGVKLLVRSQLFLLSVILCYCASRLGSFDADTVLANLTPDMEAPLVELGLTRADIVELTRATFLAVYVSVSLTALLYQGGLAFYYRRKTALLTEALREPTATPPPL